MHQLKQKIAHVFGLTDAQALGRLRDDEVDEMSRALPRVRAEDAKPLLAQLMMHYTEKGPLIPFSSSADSIIFFLDGSVSESTSLADPALANIVEGTLRNFSEQEAEIILEWLSRIGKVRFAQLCGDDVDSAIAYWSSRKK